MASTFAPSTRSNARRNRNQMKGSANAMPTMRPSSRCAYSSQKMSLELAEGHAPVDFPILGEALVVGEERLPRLLAEGRKYPHQRPPVHDREARVVEARDPTEHHHREHEAGQGQQPMDDGAAAPRDPLGRDAAAAGGPKGRSVHACVGRRQRERLRAR